MLCLLCTLILTARGRGGVQSVTIETDDGWTLRTAIDGGQVIGFLASRDPSTVPSHTFSTIWFERQTNSNFSWHGWSGQSFVAAARRVEAILGRAGLFLHDEITDSVVSPTAEAEATFISMQNGLAEFDLFQPVATLLTPEQMEAVVQFSAAGAVGLSASAIEPINCGAPGGPLGPGPGGPSEMQTQLADAAVDVERLVALPDDDAEVGLVDPAPILRPCCVPWTFVWTGRTTPGGCGPGIPALGGWCNYTCTACITRTWSQRRNLNCSWGPIVLVAVVTAPCPHSKPQTGPGVCPPP